MVVVGDVDYFCVGLCWLILIKFGCVVLGLGLVWVVVEFGGDDKLWFVIGGINV